MNCLPANKKVSRNTLEVIENELKSKFINKGIPFTKTEIETLALNAAAEHNTGVEIVQSMNHSIMYTDATDSNSGTIKPIKEVKVNLFKNEVTVIEVSGNQYTFPYGSYISKPTKNDTVKYSRDLANAMIKARPYKDILNNKDMSQEEIEATFKDVDTTTDTIQNIQQELRTLDIEQQGSSWDKGHSDHLQKVSDTIQQLSKNIADMKIEVTTNEVTGIMEPLGQFDPNKDSTKVRIIKSSYGEEARNKFNMSHEEAMVHETVHAALDWVFNLDDNVPGNHLKVQIRDLYKQASKVITVEDLMPEGQGSYTTEERAKAQEVYDYIFGKDSDVHNHTTANIRLQEFMAYAMTNKQFAAALEKYASVRKVDKKKNETIPQMLERWLSNVLAALAQKMKRVRGKNMEDEATKIVYALTAIQDRYGSKAAINKGLPLDEKFFNKLEEATNSADKKIHKAIDDTLGYVDKKTTNTRKGVAAVEEIKRLKAERKIMVDKRQAVKGMKIEDFDQSLIDRASKDYNERNTDKFEDAPQTIQLVLVKEEAIQDLHEEYQTKLNKENKDLEDVLKNISGTKNGFNFDIDKIKGDNTKISGVPKQLSHILKGSYGVAKNFAKIRANQKILEAMYGTDVIANIVSKMLYQMGIEEGGFAHNLLADFTAGRETLEKVTDSTMEFRSHIDRLRYQNFIGMLEQARKFFSKVDISSKKNNIYEQALESVILTGDIQALKINTSELKDLLANDSKIDEQIKDIEERLAKEQPYLSKVWANETQQAADFMMTSVGLRTNAENISRLFGMPYNLVVKADEVNPYAEYIEDIDKLISLKALKQAPGRDNLISLIDEDPEGVQEFMDFSRGMVRGTKEEMATDEPHNYVKGQVRDTLNNNKNLEVVPLFRKKEMKQMGYKFVRDFVKSANDIDDEPYVVMFNDNVGITKRVDGAVSLQRNKVPGLLLSDKIRMSNPTLNDEQLFKKFIEYKNVAIADMVTAPTSTDRIDGLMQPVYSIDGTINDFRYGVTKQDKLEYLDLEVRGTYVLSKSTGQVGTTTMTNTQNEKLIDLIFKDNKDRNESNNKQFNNEHLYVKVQPKEYEITETQRKKMFEKGLRDNKRKKGLEDKGKYGFKTEGEEMWGLLPPSARNYIIEKNNQEDIKNGKKPENRRELFIRKDLMTQLFAYNDPSITDLKMFQKVSVPMKNKIKKIESYWMDFASLLKNNVVIKMPSTILGNILSNAKFLIYAGMSPQKAFDYLNLSRKSLKQWKIDEQELHEYERFARSKDGAEKAKYQKLVADTKARMADNPLKPLMDKGMYQSVVEDVDILEDSNKISEFARNQLSKITDKVGGQQGLLHKTVENVFLTRKSMLGHILVNTAQESDFHFRAALHFNGASMREITDNFINYNKVINSRLMKWLDATGPEAFYKYFSNIQRVAFQKLKDSTTRVLMEKAGQHFGMLPDADIFDSSILNQIGKRTSLFDNVWDLVSGGTTIPIRHFFK